MTAERSLPSHSTVKLEMIESVLAASTAGWIGLAVGALGEADLPEVDLVAAALELEDARGRAPRRPSCSPPGPLATSACQSNSRPKPSCGISK